MLFQVSTWLLWSELNFFLLTNNKTHFHLNLYANHTNYYCMIWDNLIDLKGKRLLWLNENGSIMKPKSGDFHRLVFPVSLKVGSIPYTFWLL